MGQSGGYFSVGIAIQNARTLVNDVAKLTAGGDVSVLSNAEATVNTKASSASPETTDGSESAAGDHSVASVSNIVKLLLGQIGDVTGIAALSNLAAVIKVSSYTISANAVSNNPAQGVVAVDKTTSNAGKKVNVSIAPKEGFEVDTVRIRYLVPGDAAYTYAGVGEQGGLTQTGYHQYSFDMPAGDVVVYVT